MTMPWTGSSATVEPRYGRGPSATTSSRRSRPTCATSSRLSAFRPSSSSSRTTPSRRRQLDRFGGREIDTAGDGFFAAFEGPGKAIRCAGAVGEALTPLDLHVRAGVHTGEVEVRGEGMGGLAVHIAARVAALAGGGEVFVSGTVKDLLAGSGLEFDDRGEHEL